MKPQFLPTLGAVLFLALKTSASQVATGPDFSYEDSEPMFTQYTNSAGVKVAVVCTNNTSVTNSSNHVRCRTSHDGGITWPWSVSFLDFSHTISKTQGSDPSVIHLGNGDVVALAVGFSFANQNSLCDVPNSLVTLTSHDDGITWHIRTIYASALGTFLDRPFAIADDLNPNGFFVTANLYANNPATLSCGAPTDGPFELGMPFVIHTKDNQASFTPIQPINFLYRVQDAAIDPRVFHAQFYYPFEYANDTGRAAIGLEVCSLTNSDNAFLCTERNPDITNGTLANITTDDQSTLPGTFFRTGSSVVMSISPDGNTISAAWMDAVTYNIMYTLSRNNGYNWYTPAAVYPSTTYEFLPVLSQAGPFPELCFYHQRPYPDLGTFDFQCGHFIQTWTPLQTLGALDESATLCFGGHECRYGPWDFPGDYVWCDGEDCAYTSNTYIKQSPINTAIYQAVTQFVHFGNNGFCAITPPNTSTGGYMLLLPLIPLLLWRHHKDLNYLPILIMLLPTPGITPGAFRLQLPIGDCNGDRKVTVDEIIIGVQIAMGNEPVSTCPAFDCNHNLGVYINCLEAAESAAMDN